MPVAYIYHLTRCGEIAKLGKPQLVYAASAYFDPQGSFTFAIAPRPVSLLARGSVESPGKPAIPGALSCVSTVPARFDLARGAAEGGRRAALAHWITAPSNMLTWRSIVNRIWQYHFGSGIVDSASDFGHMGTPPTHPELLDWLAVTFRDQGGRIKPLHKMIVMSAAYRQQSAHNARNAQLDAENRYLWRMNRQRLDAESVRELDDTVVFWTTEFGRMPCSQGARGRTTIRLPLRCGWRAAESRAESVMARATNGRIRSLRSRHIAMTCMPRCCGCWGLTIRG